MVVCEMGSPRRNGGAKSNRKASPYFSGGAIETPGIGEGKTLRRGPL